VHYILTGLTRLAVVEECIPKNGIQEQENSTCTHLDELESV